MNILILGAGAIGSLLGARLSRTGASISLFSTNRAHMEAIGRDGLLIEELDSTVRNYPLASYFEPEELPGNPDLVLVVVKTYATGTAVSNILGLCSPSTTFLTLQNGIGNWERIAEIVGKEAVLAGEYRSGSDFTRSGQNPPRRQWSNPYRRARRPRLRTRPNGSFSVQGGRVGDGTK